MQLSLLARVIPPTSLLLACGSLPGPNRPAAPPAPTTSEYVTVVPDVSTYPTATTTKEPAPVDEHEDVMASILAIPPGR